MAKRKAAIVQAEIERAVRAFVSATGQRCAVELLPGGGARIIPLDAVTTSSGLPCPADEPPGPPDTADLARTGRVLL